MADFFKEVETVPEDWTSASKGYKANDGTAEAIKGAGDAIGMGVAAVDNYYQGTIKEQAKSATDELFNASGNAGAVATEGGVKGKQTPTEVQQGYDQLALLKQATKAGTLKESSFWAQAELISRQLKTRYPGYWEQIDGDMSSLLGRKPAIALHSELEQEAKAKSSADEISRKNAEQAARSVGLTEVFVADAKGKPYSTNEINRMVAQREAIKWDQESSARSYTLKKNASEATESDALLAQRNEAQTEMSLALKDMSSSLFTDSKTYREYAEKQEAYRSQGLPVPAEITQATVSAAASVQQHVKDITNKYMLKYSADAPMSKLKDNIGFLQDWADNYVANVQKGDMNYTASNTALLKGMSDHDTFKFLTANDAFRMSAAMTTAFGPQAQLSWETRNPVLRDDRDIAIQNVMENKSFLHGTPLGESINVMQQQGITSPETYNAHITRSVNALSAEEVPNKMKSNIIESIYGEGNKDFLDKGVPEKERLPMFLKLSSPQTIKSLKALHESGQITSEDYQKHVDWISRQAMYLIRDRAPDVNVVAQARKSLGVKYNDKTQRLDTFETQYKPEAQTLVGRAINEASENYLAGSSKQAINHVNYILNNLKPLIEATGDDPKTLIPRILQQSGIDLEPVDDKGKTGSEPAVAGVESHVGKAMTMNETVIKALADKVGITVKQLGDLLAVTGMVE